MKENMLMRKIINTFKYGDKRVKRSLALAIFAGVATVAFGVMALVLSNMLCFFVAIVAAFITVSLVQTFMIEEGANPTVIRPTDIGTDSSAPIEIKEEKKEKVRTERKPKKEKAPKSRKAKESKKSEENKEKKVKIKPEKAEVKKQNSNENNQTASLPEEDIHNFSKHDIREVGKLLADEPVPEQDYNPESKEHTKDNYKAITEATAASYTKKKIKKTLHKYKVIKDHRMVMVDSCAKYNIYQTPAYVWISENQFHILLIEEIPRLLMLPLFRITEISYLKKQPADEEKDYALFKKSTILTDSFRSYLPDYNHSNKTTDLTSYKNLYGIGQGIYFTNNSAKNLFDLLGVEFLVEDKVTTSNKVNVYFKDAYKANIKLRDNVLDANGYADSITKVLDDMAHSTISHNEFKDTLNLMIKNKLITDEYANHYMDVRNGIHS